MPRDAMSYLFRIVRAVALGWLLTAVPAPARSAPTESEPVPSKVGEVEATAVAVAGPDRPGVSRRAAPVVSRVRPSVAAPVSDGPHPAYPRIHVLYCVWRE